jgi:hypothetical protein
VPKVCQNAVFFVPLRLALSEKQILRSASPAHSLSALLIVVALTARRMDLLNETLAESWRRQLGRYVP